LPDKGQIMKNAVSRSHLQADYPKETTEMIAKPGNLFVITSALPFSTCGQTSPVTKHVAAEPIAPVEAHQLTGMNLMDAAGRR
jgi:hypothetical protein